MVCRGGLWSERWFLERGEEVGARAVGSGLRVSGCDAIFVDEPVAGSGASDRMVEFDHGRVGVVYGCSLVEAAVGPVGVVMSHELFEEPT